MRYNRAGAGDVPGLEGGTPNGSAQAATGRMITFGMFPELNALIDEDFKDAEGHSPPVVNV